MMLRVLRPLEDPALDAFAFSAVEAFLLEEEPAWWTRETLREALRRAGGEGRLEAAGADRFDVTPGELREIWSEAKGQLGLGEIEPLELELPERLPVGGRTPS